MFVSSTEQLLRRTVENCSDTTTWGCPSHITLMVTSLGADTRHVRPDGSGSRVERKTPSSEPAEKGARVLAALSAIGVTLAPFEGEEFGPGSGVGGVILFVEGF